jgi:hypothetical protein
MRAERQVWSVQIANRYQPIAGTRFDEVATIKLTVIS